MVRMASGHEVEALHYELILKDILAAADKLPPFPDVVWKVMPLIQRVASAGEIEKVIRYDQAIAAKVLALSRSIYYARQHSVNSLSDAVSVLGNNRLVQVILMASASRFFQGNKATPDSREQQLWRHSVATGIIGEIIARHVGHKKALKIYLASILHDIGKTVLYHYEGIYLGSTLQSMVDENIDVLESERRTLGIDHQALGRMIARRWRFPAEVIMGIGYHHHPKQAQTDQDIAAIVYAANRVTALAEATEDQPVSFDPGRDPIFVELGLTGKIVERLQGHMKEAMVGITQFLTS